jgi:hypothetical protein
MVSLSNRRLTVNRRVAGSKTPSLGRDRLAEAGGERPFEAVPCVPKSIYPPKGVCGKQASKVILAAMEAAAIEPAQQRGQRPTPRVIGKDAVEDHARTARTEHAKQLTDRPARLVVIEVVEESETPHTAEGRARKRKLLPQRCDCALIDAGHRARVAQRLVGANEIDAHATQP